MEQRDLLKDEIEQFGKVLAKILSDFIGLKSSAKTDLAIDATNQQLQNQLNIDINHLISLDREELKAYIEKNEFTEINLELLSNYLGELAIENNLKSELFLKKAINLLDIANEVSNAMSLEREMNKVKLKAKLKQLCR